MAYTEDELITRQMHDRKCRHCGSEMRTVSEDFFGEQRVCRSCGHKHGIMRPQAAVFRGTPVIGGKVKHD